MKFCAIIRNPGTKNPVNAAELTGMKGMKGDERG
jgi:hypothetical protein